MEETTNLKLPLLIPNQSQKEITHNEALVIIDNILQNGVIDKDLITPPTEPNSNDIYIIGSNATGDWEGKDKQIAFYDNGWRFIEPREGFIFWINDEDKLYTYNGTNWVETVAGGSNNSSSETNNIENLNDLIDVEITSASQYDILQHNGTNFANTKSLQQLSMIGINATADNDNKLTVKSDYILFDNATDNSKVKVNKALTTNTASHLFQSNYEGRAEFGLIANDDFTLKVSNDGSTWHNAFVVDKATGNIDFKGEITNNGNSLSATSSPDYIIERYLSNDGLSWYTKYNSGWIEQGGMIGKNYKNSTITFLVPMKNTKYIINFGNYSIALNEITNQRNICLNSYSTTGLSFANNPYIISWEVKGYYI